MKKLVIFDLDGTLLNTIADLAAATNQALQYYGYPTHETESINYLSVLCLKGNVRKRMY